MSPIDLIDLCSDDETGESNAKNGTKKLDSDLGTYRTKEGSRVKKVQHQNAIRQAQTEENRSPRLRNVVDETNLSYAAPLSSAPICRQFWKAGNYQVGQGQGLKAANQNGQNHLRVHPMFLHSNATSHKWAFGAIAELLDNAVDEIRNGAKFVTINKVSNPRDGSTALLIRDDGSGMDPEALRRCMSFGFSDKKSKDAIGQYGNGFKTSSMRLGADAILFSRHLTTRSWTQSVGLLSYTFLSLMGHDKIVVPMVYYEFDSSTTKFGPIHPHGKEYFDSNISMLLQWSPFSKEDELLKQFDDIGHHGTKIVIYNLWLNDDGDTELDFDFDAEDIRINCDPSQQMKSIQNQQIANQYHYSLRVYSSILYLRLPKYFKIILRGRVVDHYNIASDLRFPEFILYRPQTSGQMQAEVITTIGFVKEAPRVATHGFNIYHRNRLILPFWPALKDRMNSGSTGRGVVGVLEANFVEPTHSKQDFEKTSLFQRLEDRLKQMTTEYWDFHCELIGYQQVRRKPSGPLPSKELLSSRTHSHLGQPVSMSYTSPVTDSSREASSISGSFQDPVATMSDASPQSCGRPADFFQLVSQQGLKRKENNLLVDLEHARGFIGSEAYATGAICNREEQDQLYDPEKMNLLKENKRLQLQLLELLKSEEQLKNKVQQLRHDLEAAQGQYTKLLAESEMMDQLRREM